MGQRSSFRGGFRNLDILTVSCLYIYGLMLNAVKNPHFHQSNSVQGMNTRQQNKLCVPLVRLSTKQKGVYCSSVKIFTQLSQNIFTFHNNIHTFRAVSRDRLVTNTFHSIEEFLSTGHNNVEIRTSLFNLFYYSVMHIDTLNYFELMICSL